jgi:hypothetical protein
LHRRGFSGYVESHDDDNIYWYGFDGFVDDSNLVTRQAFFFAVGSSASFVFFLPTDLSIAPSTVALAKVEAFGAGGCGD